MFHGPLAIQNVVLIAVSLPIILYFYRFVFFFNEILYLETADAMPKFQAKQPTLITDALPKAFNKEHSGKISGFLRIYHKLLQKLKGRKYDKITAAVCARFNLRCMHIIKDHKAPQIYLDAIRTRLLPDYHASNSEVAKECGKYPFTETFKEILVLYTKMELNSYATDAHDRIIRTLMNIFYDIAKLDRNVEDVRCMSVVATIQILQQIDGYQSIKNALLKKLTVKLGSPVLSEIFNKCEGKNLYECKKVIPKDHPDIQKIRKAVEVFNSWFPDYIDVEDYDDIDDVEFVPSETCKTETVTNIKEELIAVKEEGPREVGLVDLTNDEPVVSLSWEVRTDMRKRCNQKAYNFMGTVSNIQSPSRRTIKEAWNGDVTFISSDSDDDEEEVLRVKGVISQLTDTDTKKPVLDQIDKDLDRPLISLNNATDIPKSNKLAISGPHIAFQSNEQQTPSFLSEQKAANDTSNVQSPSRKSVEKEKPKNNDITFISDNDDEDGILLVDSTKAYLKESAAKQPISVTTVKIIDKVEAVCSNNVTDLPKTNKLDLSDPLITSQNKEQEKCLFLSEQKAVNVISNIESPHQKSIDEKNTDATFISDDGDDADEILCIESATPFLNELAEKTTNNGEIICSSTADSQKPNNIEVSVAHIVTENNDNIITIDDAENEARNCNDEIVVINCNSECAKELEEKLSSIDKAPEEVISDDAFLEKEVESKQIPFQQSPIRNEIAILDEEETEHTTENHQSQCCNVSLEKNEKRIDCLEVTPTEAVEENKTEDKTNFAVDSSESNTSTLESVAELDIDNNIHLVSPSIVPNSEILSAPLAQISSETERQIIEELLRDVLCAVDTEVEGSAVSQTEKIVNDSIEIAECETSGCSEEMFRIDEEMIECDENVTSLGVDIDVERAIEETSDETTCADLDELDYKKTAELKQIEAVNKLPQSITASETLSRNISPEFDLKNTVNEAEEVIQCEQPPSTGTTEKLPGDEIIPEPTYKETAESKEIEKLNHSEQPQSPTITDNSVPDKITSETDYEKTAQLKVVEIKQYLEPLSVITTKKLTDCRTPPEANYKETVELKKVEEVNQLPQLRERSIQDTVPLENLKEFSCVVTEVQSNLETTPSNSTDNNCVGSENVVTENKLETHYDSSTSRESETTVIVQRLPVLQQNISETYYTESKELPLSLEECEINLQENRTDRHVEDDKSKCAEANQKSDEHCGECETEFQLEEGDSQESVDTVSSSEQPLQELKLSLQRQRESHTDVLNDDTFPEPVDAIGEDKKPCDSHKITPVSSPKAKENVPELQTATQELLEKRPADHNASRTDYKKKDSETTCTSVESQTCDNSEKKPLVNNETAKISSTSLPVEYSEEPYYSSGLCMLADMADVAGCVVQPSSLLNQDISQSFTRNYIHQEEKFLSINKKTKQIDSDSSDNSDYGLTIDASTPARDDEHSRSPQSNIHGEDNQKLHRTTDHSIMSILTKDIKNNRSPEQVQKKKQASLYLRQKEQNLAVDLSQKSHTEPRFVKSNGTEPLKVRTKAERKEAQMLPMEMNYQNENKISSNTPSPRSRKRKGASPVKRTPTKTQYEEPVVSVSPLAERLPEKKTRGESFLEIPKKRGRFSSESNDDVQKKSGKSQGKGSSKDRLFKSENVNKLVEAITACAKTSETFKEDLVVEKICEKEENQPKKLNSQEKACSGVNLPPKAKNKSKKSKRNDVKPKTVTLPREKEISTSKMPPKKRETRKSFEENTLIQEQLDVNVSTPKMDVSSSKDAEVVTKSSKTRNKGVKRPAQSCRRSPRRASRCNSSEELEINFEAENVLKAPETEPLASKIEPEKSSKRRRRTKSKASLEIENVIKPEETNVCIVSKSEEPPKNAEKIVTEVKVNFVAKEEEKVKDCVIESNCEKEQVVTEEIECEPQKKEEINCKSQKQESEETKEIMKENLVEEVREIVEESGVVNEKETTKYVQEGTNSVEDVAETNTGTTNQIDRQIIEDSCNDDVPALQEKESFVSVEPNIQENEVRIEESVVVIEKTGENRDNAIDAQEEIPSADLQNVTTSVCETDSATENVLYEGIELPLKQTEKATPLEAVNEANVAGEVVTIVEDVSSETKESTIIPAPVESNIHVDEKMFEEKAPVSKENIELGTENRNIPETESRIIPELDEMPTIPEDSIVQTEIVELAEATICNVEGSASPISKKSENEQENSNIEVVTVIEMVPNPETIVDVNCENKDLKYSTDLDIAEETDKSKLTSDSESLLYSNIAEKRLETPFPDIPISTEEIPLPSSNISVPSITATVPSVSTAELTEFTQNILPSIPDSSSNTIQDLLTSLCSDLSTASTLKPIDTLATTRTVIFTEAGGVLEVPVSLNYTESKGDVTPTVLYEPTSSLMSIAVTTVSASTSVITSSHMLVKPSTSCDFVTHDPTTTLDFVNEIDYDPFSLEDVEIPLTENGKQSDTSDGAQHCHSLGPFMGPSEQKAKTSSNDDLTTLPEEKNKNVNKSSTDMSEEPQTDLEDNSPLDAVVAFPPESVPFANEFFTGNNQVPCGSNQVSVSETMFPLINSDKAARKFQLLDQKELEGFLSQVESTGEPLTGNLNSLSDHGGTETNPPPDELCGVDQFVINTSASFLPPKLTAQTAPIVNEFKRIVLKDYTGVQEERNNHAENNVVSPDKLSKRKVENEETAKEVTCGRTKRRKSSVDQHTTGEIENKINYVINELLKVNEEAKSNQKTVESTTADAVTTNNIHENCEKLKIKTKKIEINEIPLPHSPPPPKLEKYDAPQERLLQENLKNEKHGGEVSVKKRPATLRADIIADQRKPASSVQEKKTVAEMGKYYVRQASFTRPPTSGRKTKSSPLSDETVSSKLSNEARKADVFESASLKFDALVHGTNTEQNKKTPDIRKSPLGQRLDDFTKRFIKPPSEHKTHTKNPSSNNDVMLDASKLSSVKQNNKRIQHSEPKRELHSVDNANPKLELLRRSQESRAYKSSKTATNSEKRTAEVPLEKPSLKSLQTTTSTRINRLQPAVTTRHQLLNMKRPHNNYGTPITDRSSSNRSYDMHYPAQNSRDRSNMNTYPRPKSEYMRSSRRSPHINTDSFKLQKHDQQLFSSGTSDNTSWREKLSGLVRNLPENVDFPTSSDKSNKTSRS